MSLPYGKRIQCGNYYLLKHTRSLDRHSLQSLRSVWPLDIRKHLCRGVLPYLMVGSVSDTWRIEFACGTTMYKALDELPLGPDGELTPSAVSALSAVVTGWYAYTGTVGDAEYQSSVLQSLQGYLARASSRESAPLSKKDNKAVLQELEAREKSVATLEGMVEALLDG